MKIRVSQEFSKSCGEVYGAFLNPELAKRFLFATPTGTMVRAELNARVGGEFAFVDRRDGVDVLHTGHYVELDEGKRLAFDFKVPMYSEASCRVMLEFTPVGEGCRVDLTCEGVPEEWVEASRQGWAGILETAEKVLAE